MAPKFSKKIAKAYAMFHGNTLFLTFLLLLLYIFLSILVLVSCFFLVKDKKMKIPAKPETKEEAPATKEEAQEKDISQTPNQIVTEEETPWGYTLKGTLNGGLLRFRGQLQERGAVEPKTKKEPAAEDPSPAAPSETETKEESEEVKDNGGGGEVPSMAHDYQPRYSED
ncbi:hypothetical protein HHK36_006811 [Tetracentron sinense]|uniref:Uncharacterized protein n=1 Tax=Tetracentron sinense TaxID=13715 RepID=A0A834ZQF6_TETSI|nr:hypothetical protein HHK36_006811 [Tetracentron sinense]